MAGVTTLRLGAAQAIGQTRFEARAATRETPVVKWLILGTALTFFAVFLLMPLIAVFVEALRKGAGRPTPARWSTRTRCRRCA